VRKHLDTVGSGGGLAFISLLALLGPDTLIAAQSILLSDYQAAPTERGIHQLTWWSVGLHVVLDVPMLGVIYSLQMTNHEPWDQLSELAIGVIALNLVLNLPFHISRVSQSEYYGQEH